MNRSGRQDIIVVLFCSDALAILLGAEPVDQPAGVSAILDKHMAGLKDGSVIAVMAQSGENFLWPLRSAA